MPGTPAPTWPLQAQLDAQRSGLAHRRESALQAPMALLGLAWLVLPIVEFTRGLGPPAMRKRRARRVLRQPSRTIAVLYSRRARIRRHATMARPRIEGMPTFARFPEDP